MLWCTSWEALCIRSLILYRCVKGITFKSPLTFKFIVSKWVKKNARCQRCDDIKQKVWRSFKFSQYILFLCHVVTIHAVFAVKSTCRTSFMFQTRNFILPEIKSAHLSTRNILCKHVRQGCLYFHEQLHWNLCEKKGKHYAEQLVWGVSLIGV